MRKEIYRMDRAEAVALLARAPAVHVATTRADGAPLLRTLHAVVVDDYVAFHGAPAGEKVEALGREAVVCAEEVVAEVPSHFLDPERACPATTYYRAAQAHGALEAVDDPAWKARALQALMEKYQPEGGHVPIAHDHPLYRKAVDGILVVRVALERLDGKAKLGQNRAPRELTTLCEKLWARGRPGDPAAVDAILGANPGAPTPSFLACPAGATLACAAGERDLPRAVDLLADAYWNAGRFTRDEIAAAHRGASAWVCARDGAGALVASARAVGDGAKYATVYDVVVDRAWRGKGLGKAVVALVLDHPAVRGARVVTLRTRDAHGLYARFGFRDAAALPPRPYASTEMVRAREG